jgi:hypothetical protein
MALQNYQVMSTSEQSFEVKLAMLQMGDPFDRESLPFRLRDLLQQQETLPKSYLIISSEDTRWNYVDADTLVLRLPEDTGSYTDIERIVREEYGIKPVATQ